MINKEEKLKNEEKQVVILSFFYKRICKLSRRDWT